MIGKPVSPTELKGVLEKEKAFEDLLQDLKEELRSIKKGECLAYKLNPELPAIIRSLPLDQIIAEIKGLKKARQGDTVYVYRE